MPELIMMGALCLYLALRERNHRKDMSAMFAYVARLQVQIISSNPAGQG